MARLIRRLAPLVLFATSALALSSCGTSGAVTQARIACRYVDQSLTIYRQSTQPGVGASTRVSQQARALALLLRATPYAASATSIDGGWNPLMTTINEAERVPIVDLIPSLTHLCRIAQSATPYL